MVRPHRTRRISEDAVEVYYTGQMLLPSPNQQCQCQRAERRVMIATQNCALWVFQRIRGVLRNVLYKCTILTYFIYLC